MMLNDAKKVEKSLFDVKFDVKFECGTVLVHFLWKIHWN